MANLVIDIGNTFTKIAVFEGDNAVKFEKFSVVDIARLKQFLAGYSVKQVLISSVKRSRGEWELVLAGEIPTAYFNSGMAVNIKNHYNTPQTLGPDRLAAVTGARQLYPHNGNMVINAGSCITYDWVDADGNYYGGSISPGLNMRYKALNYYTSALPLISADDTFTAGFGNDTETAIRSGVQNGIKHELNGFIESCRKRDPEANIILSGGYGIFFDTLLKNSIFAPYIKNEPYLVLEGLNAAIQNNND